MDDDMDLRKNTVTPIAHALFVTTFCALRTACHPKAASTLLLTLSEELVQGVECQRIGGKEGLQRQLR